MKSLHDLKSGTLQRHRFRSLTGLLVALLLSAGCAQLRFPGQQAEAKLDMQVLPAESPGTYRLTGSTNLPDNTKITIAAVRYLQIGEPTALVELPQTYSILDYDSIEVEKGSWQAALNLWETAPDGRYQETWQLDQRRLGLILEPASDVIFLATLAPIEELSEIERLLAERGLRLQRGMVQSTAEGQRYVQVSQTRSIALPNERTAAPPVRPEDRNGGWGDRFIIPFEPQNPTPIQPENVRQTNAPLAPEDLLQ